MAVGNIGAGELIGKANAKVLGQVENHCPFGCARTDLDDKGHCRHLIGFTNDKKVYEPVRPWRIPTKDGRGMKSTGTFHVVGALARPINQDEVKKGVVKLVNPTEEQKIDGVLYLADRWVSARVYHKDGQWPLAEQLFCAKCEVALPEAARFCPECGHRAAHLPPAKLQCPNTACGAIVETGTKFCPECGGVFPEPEADKKAS